MFSGKTIFIAPLDWGLGHATRCIPIIHRLIKNNQIIIGTTSLNAAFFEAHFPALPKIVLPSYNIRYSAHLPVWLTVLLQGPKINAVIKQEHHLLKNLIRKYAIDVIISDSRFGLRSEHVTSIFISHQLKILSPFLAFLANRINRKFIHAFNEVWVPDYKDEGERLSGCLSDSKEIKIPVKYIGPQSRLSEYKSNLDHREKIDYLILLSGIEPQRTVLEKMLVDVFKDSEKKVVLVRGSRTMPPLIDSAILVKEFAEDLELCHLLVNAETIICRSGYSSLMDLHVLGKKKLILVPTPGQTEQEYLARYWKEKFNATFLPQHHIHRDKFNF